MKIRKIKELEPYLKKRIKGQDHAVSRIARVIRKAELGLSQAGKPKGSFLFVGPTGTGKTEIALAFTEYLLGKDKLIRFDMSEFMNASSLGRFIGEREGEIGLLGQKLKAHSSGTLLFDEMEKAEPRILDLFLQILDTGRITLSDGKIRKLNDYYLVFTSNIGSSDIRHMRRASLATIERVVLSQVNETLRPELVGRIDEIIVFNKLSYEVQESLCRSMIASEVKALAQKGHALEITESVVNFLIQKGFHKTLGARPMKRAINNHLSDLVAKQILKNLPTNGRVITNASKTDLLLEPCDTAFGSMEDAFRKEGLLAFSL